MNVHVTPTNDLIAHEHTDTCVCRPDPHYVTGGTIHVHHTLDGRERHEAID